MSAMLSNIDQLAWVALSGGFIVAAVMALFVIGGRVFLAAHQRRLRRLERLYGAVIERALAGDRSALDVLVRSPSRYRLELARLLIFPLVADRNQQRIEATRHILSAMSLVAVADRWLHSRFWWRRVAAVHTFGLLRFADRAAELVAALDDEHKEVRNAALDALADLRDSSTLPAIVVRLQDASLSRGRRAAALAAFGSECEELLLELARVDVENRLHYAKALAISGTARSRPILCEWAADPRPAVRAAALGALGCIGLDDRAAAVVLAALDHGNVEERVAAAAALQGWVGGDAPPHLAKRLDDAWPVAVRAARTLQSMGDAGQVELAALAAGTDQASVLARQMLWEVETRA